MARFVLVAVLVAAFVCMVSSDGLVDSLASAAGRAIAGFGDVFMPHSMMKAGCKEVDVAYNKNKRDGIFDELAKAAGRGIAGLGTVIMPKSMMTSGCREIGLTANNNPPQQVVPIGGGPIYVFDPPTIEY